MTAPSSLLVKVLSNKSTKNQTPTAPASLSLHDVDLFGDPIEPPKPSPVQALVAAYIDAVRDSGGIATASMIGAIGKNVKRLLDQDHLEPAVILVACQRAGARRTRTLDVYLGDAQQVFERGGTGRRELFAAWAKLYGPRDESPPTTLREIGS